MNRKLTILNLQDARRELQKIQVSSQGVEVMAPKALQMAIKLTNIKLGAANILKQEMLSIGGDAAVARGVVNGAMPISDVILLGNADKIRKLIKKLDHQTIFGLPGIADDLKKIIDQELGKRINVLRCGKHTIELDQTRIMGILNVTPDSFSDGGSFVDPMKAADYAIQMLDDGADIIDIGGESTRPGSEQVSIDEEKRRTLPVIEEILRRRPDAVISIDTNKAEIAKAAIAAGASIVNDISALLFDGKMARVVGDRPDVAVILMHMQGTPRDMQKDPHYDDTIEDILCFFCDRVKFCNESGISNIMIDPGIGFGKRHEDNLIILKKLAEFNTFGLPVVLGASRKSFIGRIYPSEPIERLSGSLATTALAHEAGIAIVRVHDPKPHRELLDTLRAVREAK